MPEKDSRNHRQPVVLVCPLDWGLGHASRMIPVIRSFQLSHFTVLIGTSGLSGKLLEEQFPELQFIQLPSVRITYSKGNSQLLAMARQLPRMFFLLRKEHRIIQQIILDRHVDILVSDNRYGLYSRHAYTILVTHQPSPVLPSIVRFLELPIGILLRFIINRFDECWIPDVADRKKSLSGSLSHRFRLPANTRYIGLLSRFNSPVQPVIPPLKYDLVIISSGPEPQAGIFIRLMAEQAARLPYRCLIICGLTDKYMSLASPERPELVMVKHMKEEDFMQALLLADIIICRPGYSTLMDLITLGKSAILIPTPGQTEQLYLARRLAARNIFHVCSQQHFDMKTAVQDFRRIDHSSVQSYKNSLSEATAPDVEYLREIVPE